VQRYEFNFKKDSDTIKISPRPIEEECNKKGPEGP